MPASPVHSAHRRSIVRVIAVTLVAFAGGTVAVIASPALLVVLSSHIVWAIVGPIIVVVALAIVRGRMDDKETPDAERTALDKLIQLFIWWP
jgi:hypothetical protein